MTSVTLRRPRLPRGAYNGIVPAPKAEPTMYGLFSVADVVDHTAADERWVGGLSWVNEVCAYDARIINVCGPDDITLVESSSTESGAAPGFAIDVTDACTTTFGMDAAEHQARIKRAVDMLTELAVERVLWSGIDVNPGTWGATDDDRYPSFQDSNATVLNGGAPLDPLPALAAIEEAVSESVGIRSTLHMNRRVGTMMMSLSEPTGVPPYLNTKLGTKMAMGSGYERSGPGGTPATGGTGWIFATGPVVVHLGPLIMYEAPDVRTNDVYMKAERPAAVAWDRCLLYAVQVTI